MKKLVFITLLSISLTAFAIASVPSHSGSFSTVVNNIADTTPMHHHTTKKWSHDSTSSSSTMHHSGKKMHTTKKSMSDSTMQK